MVSLHSFFLSRHFHFMKMKWGSEGKRGSKWLLRKVKTRFFVHVPQFQSKQRYVG